MYSKGITGKLDNHDKPQSPRKAQEKGREGTNLQNSVDRGNMQKLSKRPASFGGPYLRRRPKKIRIGKNKKNNTFSYCS